MRISWCLPGIWVIILIREGILQIKIRNLSELGKALKNRRKDLGITQKELASICNLSHNGISRIEMGESDVKLSTLLKMGQILGIDLILDLGE
ncbi:MAG: XRE family transcriptional regulator [Epsilonproteobacteria bacterium]|nr:MAG: XRE family transcriptional regulator [Campylobacterota bacterium]